MTTPTPWWANDPELAKIRQRTAKEFGIDLDATDPADPADPDDLDGPDEVDESFTPDPIMTEVLDGRCGRELIKARDGLAEARDRYDAAVLDARTAGLSWAEIGRALGVSRQQLHRSFAVRQRSRP